MWWLWSAAGLAFAATLVTWRRRAAAARGQSRRLLEEFLSRRRPPGPESMATARAVALRRDGVELASIDLGRLAAAVGGRDAAARERLFRSIADAADARPRPLAGRYELKRHGMRTLPRLVSEGIELAAPQPPVLSRAIAAGALSALFVIENEPGLSYLTEEHLAEAGLDVRDLLNVSLAVLRQRFDEAAARRPLDAGDVGRIEAADGCGASRILLLPEALRGGETAFAAAPTPSRLLFAGQRSSLEAALAAGDDAPDPLPPALFEVSRNGIRAV